MVQGDKWFRYGRPWLAELSEGMNGVMEKRFITFPDSGYWGEHATGVSLHLVVTASVPLVVSAGEPALG